MDSQEWILNHGFSKNGFSKNGFSRMDSQELDCWLAAWPRAPMFSRIHSRESIPENPSFENPSLRIHPQKSKSNLNPTYGIWQICTEINVLDILRPGLWSASRSESNGHSPGSKIRFSFGGEGGEVVIPMMGLSSPLEQSKLGLNTITLFTYHSSTS